MQWPSSAQKVHDDIISRADCFTFSLPRTAIVDSTEACVTYTVYCVAYCVGYCVLPVYYQSFLCSESRIILQSE